MTTKREEMGFYESKTPHFFKVILKDDVVHPKNLRVPSKFAREYGSSLSDWVCLEVPCSSTWDVGVHRDDQGQLLLRDGWAEFMRHYDIDHGHFIVFRYEGGSRFRVIILNRTACEIKYPVKSPSDAKSGPTTKKEIINEECIRSTVSGKRKSRVHCTRRPSKKPKGVKILKMNGVNNGHMSFNSHLNNNPAAKAARDSGALKKALFFKCQNLSSLIITQPSYLHPSYTLYLSKKFLVACIPDIRGSFDMKLRTSGKKTWTVGCSLRNLKGRPIACRGWRDFVMDNNLRVGDVCVFEFLGGADTTFRITIFRAKGVA